MNLAISNIAWDVHEDVDIIKILNNSGVHGIEIAPTKVWRHPMECTCLEAEDFRGYWEQNDIRLVAMQSLLFGKNHLNLFSDQESRLEMIKYLSSIISLAGTLGIESLVFGSPKNRLVGSLSKEEQFNIAIPFFYELGSIAAKENVVICIEPNPAQYGCDFVTNTEEGLALVQEVGHDGVKLHLDSGALFLNNEDVSIAIEKAMPYLNHFHISEPFLNLIGTESTPHERISKALKSAGYQKWVSIEMKNNLTNSNIDSVERALNYAMKFYY